MKNLFYSMVLSVVVAAVQSPARADEDATSCISYDGDTDEDGNEIWDCGTIFTVDANGN